MIEFIHPMNDPALLSLAGMAQIDLNLLVALEALLEERSVTRAGRRIGLSQPAMSNALSRLREHLDDALLVRSGGGMALTPHAEAILPQLREALVQVRRVVEKPRPFDPQTANQRFSLLATDFIEMVALPSLAGRVLRAAPRITLDVRPFGEIEAVEGLRSGALDLVLGVYSEAPVGCHLAPLFQEGFLCVVRRGNPALGKGRLTLKRYAALPHLLVAPRRSGPGAVDVALQKQGLSRRVALYVSHFLVAPLIVAQSDLVATLPARAARLLAAHHDLLLMKPPVALSGFTVSQVWHDRTDTSPPHRWLRAQVTAACAS
jgi:DNA-binding transcriptional LysR family regulator